jgi:4-carboxymuconolactone decarboxylase
MEVRRQVLGDDHVDRAERTKSAFTAPFQEYITGAAWADVWARPGIDRRMRSAITLALLTSLGAEDELAMHVRAARRNGLTEEEIAEVLLHAAVYVGVPAANRAFAIAEEALDRKEVPGPATPEPAESAPDREEPA